MKPLSIVILLLIYLPQLLRGATHYSVIIGPSYPGPEAEKAVSELARLCLEYAAPGDYLDLYNGQTITRIGSMRVPTGSPRQRAEAARGALTEAQALFAPKIDPVDDLHAGQIRINMVADLLARIPVEGESHRVLIFANPSFLSPLEGDRGYAFIGSWIANDRVLTAPSWESIFGTGGLAGMLKGKSVYWLTPTFEQCDDHFKRTHRFYYHFLQQLGAALPYFGKDAKECFRAAVQGETPSPASFPPLDLSVREMGKVDCCPELSLPGMQPTNLPVALRADQRQVLTQNLGRISRQWLGQPGKLTIAIAWVGPASSDVDLYSRAGAGRRVSFFQRPDVDGAHLHRDVRSAGGIGSRIWRTSWEVVHFDHDQLDEAEVWLNLYLGGRERVAGIIRVFHKGVARDGEFSFPVSNGDGGWGWATRQESATWRPVDLRRIWGPESAEH